MARFGTEPCTPHVLVRRVAAVCLPAVFRAVHNLTRKLILQRHRVTSPVYDLIIFPVVLHGCETWFLTLREERRLRVFENRVLRKVFRSHEER
jgi:hypothetical protein